MNAFAVPTLLALAFTTPQCAAYDFKGLHMGAPTSAEDVLDKLNIVCGEGVESSLVCNGMTTVADVDAQANIVIDASGKLQRVALTFHAAYFAGALDALVAKFGKPTRTLRVPLQNVYGARYVRIERLWANRRGDRIEADDMTSSPDEASITFNTAAERKQFGRAGPSAKALKDL